MALITKTEIAKYREISKSLRDEKINPYIDDAEFLDLRPMLGASLYHDLVANKADAKYVELMEGGDYQYNGETYYFPGLEKVLCLFAYARYVMFGSNTDTSFGFVQKSNQDSTPVPDITKKTIYTKDRQAAVEYFAEIAAFLSRNKDTYPKWRTGSCGRTGFGGFRISKITKD